MTPSVSTVVMAHKRRAAFVTELLAKLDRPAEVIWDRRGDRWDTGRRSMLAFDPEASHHLVVQDDAVVPRDLVAGIEKALTHVPAGSPLCLYTGRVRPYREKIQELVGAAGPGTTWLAMSQLHWGVGIVMPTKWIPDMVAWCDPRNDIPNYDRRISRWCQLQALTVYYPWPSLVDHRQSPSLVPGRGWAGRRAYRFIGADRSALEQRYDGRVVAIPPLGGTASPATAPGGKTRGGKSVKFISPKYPQLQAHTTLPDGTVVRVRFRNGHAEAKHPAVVEHLRGLAHMGVEQVGSQPAGPEPNGEQPAETPTDAAEQPVADEPPAEPEQEPAPEQPTSEPAAGDGVPAGGAKEVLAWVGDDPQRARQALDAEQGRDKPRSTLVATLTKLAG